MPLSYWEAIVTAGVTITKIVYYGYICMKEVKEKYVTIHQHNLQLLMVEIFKQKMIYMLRNIHYWGIIEQDYWMLNWDPFYPEVNFHCLLVWISIKGHVPVMSLPLDNV